MVQKCNKVQPKHGKVTQNMHGASRNYRYVWDVSPINGDATISTLEEETSMNIEAFKQVSLNDITTSLIVDSSELDFDNCTLPEVIGFLHKMSRDPHTSTINLAFRVSSSEGYLY